VSIITSPLNVIIHQFAMRPEVALIEHRGKTASRTGPTGFWPSTSSGSRSTFSAPAARGWAGDSSRSWRRSDPTGCSRLPSGLSLATARRARSPGTSRPSSSSSVCWKARPSGPSPTLLTTNALARIAPSRGFRVSGGDARCPAGRRDPQSIETPKADAHSPPGGTPARVLRPLRLGEYCSHPVARGRALRDTTTLPSLAPGGASSYDPARNHHNIELRVDQILD
jgi:hypothetical protein